MRKALVVVLLVVLVGCVVLPLVSADSVLTGYSFDNYSTLLMVPRAQPTDQTYRSAVGETFTLGSDSYINSVVFYIDHSGAEVLSDVYAAVYAVSEGLPTGSALLVSSTHIQAAVVRPVTPQAIEFTFESTLFDAGDYAVVLYNTVYSGSFSQGYEVASDNSAPSYADGVAVEYVQSAWSVVAGQDVCFALNGEVFTPTPSPSPSPSPTPTLGVTGTASPSGFGDFGSGFYWIFIILGACVAFLFGLFALLGDKGNRAVNVLIAVVSLVVFVVVLFAIGVL